MEPLVSVDWLAEHLADPDLPVFDATVQISRVLFLPRIRTGQREYRRAHVPGSGFLFLDLFAVHDPHRSRLSMTAPTAGHFEEVVGRLGIGNLTRAPRTRGCTRGCTSGFVTGGTGRTSVPRT